MYASSIHNGIGQWSYVGTTYKKGGRINRVYENSNKNISKSKFRNKRTVDFTILFNASPNVALDVNAEMKSAIQLLYKRLFK